MSHAEPIPPSDHYPTQETLRTLFYAMAPTQAEQARLLSVDDRTVKRWLAARTCRSFRRCPHAIIQLVRILGRPEEVRKRKRRPPPANHGSGDATPPQ